MSTWASAKLEVALVNISSIRHMYIIRMWYVHPSWLRCDQDVRKEMTTWQAVHKRRYKYAFGASIHSRNLGVDNSSTVPYPCGPKIHQLLPSDVTEPHVKERAQVLLPPSTTIHPAVLRKKIHGSLESSWLKVDREFLLRLSLCNFLWIRDNEQIPLLWAWNWNCY